ncbi:hypothetical protein Thimo_1233 [Thioflavicoccus mobilis 8321]|uniref:Uncharacterized protein n=1 Tax=Thioflavicoccus mobilis 8321 TaxID=765912 RepID=L0GVP3_9GAMM|nr:hypothetical protein [Thioflavicoccus mobilis]AGA90031.1 hypothetical protein Thimo_1233 [Thioflavicoccus mobilis 8321]
MTEIWQQSPDGRPLVIDPEGGYHAAFLPRTADAPRPLAAFEPFVTACLAALPEHQREPGARLGLELFLLGAARRFRHAEPLADEELLAGLADLFERHGIARGRLLDLLGELPALERAQATRQVLDEGAATVEEWLASHNQNLTVRVRERLPDWARDLEA